MRLLRSVVVAALVATSSAVAVDAAAQFDHLKCYPIKDPLPKAKYSADLIPEKMPPFASASGCEIKVPAKLLCTDVAKTNVVPPPPSAVDAGDAGDVFCYALRCPRDATIPKGGLPVEAEDQFGRRVVAVQKQPRLLCAPVSLAIPTPVVTPTSGTPTPATPTPTATPTAAGGTCVDSVGACVCPRPATPTPQPTCTGSCPTATAATPVPSPSPPLCGQFFDPPFCTIGTCPLDETCVVAGDVCACAPCCPCP